MNKRKQLLLSVTWFFAGINGVFALLGIPELRIMSTITFIIGIISGTIQLMIEK